jgi:hypothetical protein
MSYLVHYEQLTLDTDKTMKKVLKYLNIDHKNYHNKNVNIDKQKAFEWYPNIKIGEFLKFSDNATMIKKLGYVMSNQVPTYESYKNFFDN